LSKPKSKKQEDDRVNLSLYGNKAKRFLKLNAIQDLSYADTVNQLVIKEFKKMGLEDIES